MSSHAGKETQEAKDDPTRFYILDPCLLTVGSPSLSRDSAQTTPSQSMSPHPDPPPTTTKTSKKQSSSQKRTSVATGSDNHSEGISPDLSWAQAVDRKYM